MKTTLVSTAAMQNAAKLAIQRAQSDIVDRQVELTTGKHADIGLALGSQSAKSISLGREVARLVGNTRRFVRQTRLCVEPRRLRRTAEALCDPRSIALAAEIEKPAVGLLVFPGRFEPLNREECLGVDHVNLLA